MIGRIMDIHCLSATQNACLRISYSNDLMHHAAIILGYSENLATAISINAINKGPLQQYYSTACQ